MNPGDLARARVRRAVRLVDGAAVQLEEARQFLASIDGASEVYDAARVLLDQVATFRTALEEVGRSGTLKVDREGSP